MAAADSPSANSLKRRRTARSGLESVTTPSKANETTPAKRRRLGGDTADIYDDIEGAHDTEIQRSTRRRSNGVANGTDASPRGDLNGSKSTSRRGRRSAKDDEEESSAPAALGRSRPYLNGSTPQKQSPGRSRLGRDMLTNSAARDGNNVSADPFEDELASPHKPSPARKPAAKASSLRSRLANAGNGALSRTNAKNGWPDSPASDAEQDLLDMQLGIDIGKPTSTPRSKISRTASHTQASTRKLEDDEDEDEEGVDLIKTNHPDQVSKAPTKAAQLNQKLSKTSSHNRPREQDTEEDPEHFEVVQSAVLAKITSRRPIPLTNLDEEYAKVHSLLLNTVVAGEGNSMLLIGARGSGKSALVEKALRELGNKHAGEYHVVRLSGFFQTDDKIALKEIWRQLGREMEVDDDTSSKSYADTLATLLALLSQPTESGANAADQIAKAIFFIMDEFDLFASHPRQTLLYNLFDIAQSRKAPIAVLGLTTRIDVSESLEKRVKSRFSHRYVHISLPKTFAQFQEVCKAVLQVQPDELSAAEKEILEQKPKPTKRGSKTGQKDFLASWNASIEVR
jgi:origin recognition complex subunit 4